MWTCSSRVRGFPPWGGTLQDIRVAVLRPYDSSYVSVYHMAFYSSISFHILIYLSISLYIIISLCIQIYHRISFYDPVLVLWVPVYTYGVPMLALKDCAGV